MGTAGRETVLVVTDASGTLAASERLDGPYSVRTARTLTEGTELLDSDVVVLVVDEQLPDGPGRRLVDRASERPLAPRSAVLSRTEGPFPAFDLVLDARPSADALDDAMERLVSLRTYDERIERLYELAKEESRSPPAAVGDGGFEHVPEEVRRARAAADDALRGVHGEDRRRLLVDAMPHEEDT